MRRVTAVHSTFWLKGTWRKGQNGDGGWDNLTRYFAIWRRNLGENWQEGFYEVQKADCLEKSQKQRREEREDGCVQPLMVGGEKPGEVEELYAIDVYTGEVTDVADSINSPREPPLTCTLDS
jgi:hypothetical protein